MNRPETINLTTLGYIEKDGAWLMLKRNKKENDINEGKVIGIGGKVEPKETILEGMIRECKEETGLDWLDPHLNGIITFNLASEDQRICEQMFLFTGSRFQGKLIDCREGELIWVKQDQIQDLPIWKGDQIFFALLKQKAPFFFLRLDYREDELIFASLEGKELDLNQDFTRPYSEWIYH